MNRIPLYLGSQSQDRKNLLKGRFTIDRQISSPFHEEGAPGDAVKKEAGGDPVKHCDLLAQAKAEAIIANMGQEVRDGVLICCDTIDDFNYQILEKPIDKHDAEIMVRQMSHHSTDAMREVRVHTGLSIAALNVFTNEYETISTTHTTKFRWNQLTKQDIEAYLADQNVLSCCGAISITDGNEMWIQTIDGQPSDIIGIPLSALMQQMKTLGYRYDGKQRGFVPMQTARQ